MKSNPVPQAMRNLWAAHQAEADRRGAEILNFGWASTDGGIASKTSLGILDTDYDTELNCYVHKWTS